MTKPFPPGVDDWSHPYHLPDNNPLSQDQVARGPYLTQFLAESSLLSLLGGLIGVLLGWLIAVGIEQVSIVLGSPFNTSISIDSILLATLFSAAVGLFFGLYPANRAASLEPVEALRYE